MHHCGRTALHDVLFCYVPAAWVSAALQLVATWLLGADQPVA